MGLCASSTRGSCSDTTLGNNERVPRSLREAATPAFAAYVKTQLRSGHVITAMHDPSARTIVLGLRPPRPGAPGPLRLCVEETAADEAIIRPTDELVSIDGALVAIRDDAARTFLLETTRRLLAPRGPSKGLKVRALVFVRGSRRDEALAESRERRAMAARDLSSSEHFEPLVERARRAREAAITYAAVAERACCRSGVSAPHDGDSSNDGRLLGVAVRQAREAAIAARSCANAASAVVTALIKAVSEVEHGADALCDPSRTQVRAATARDAALDLAADASRAAITASGRASEIEVRSLTCDAHIALADARASLDARLAVRLSAPQLQSALNATARARSAADVALYACTRARNVCLAGRAQTAVTEAHLAFDALTVDAYEIRDNADALHQAMHGLQCAAVAQAEAVRRPGDLAAVATASTAATAAVETAHMASTGTHKAAPELHSTKAAPDEITVWRRGRVTAELTALQAASEQARNVASAHAAHEIRLAASSLAIRAAEAARAVARGLTLEDDHYDTPTAILRACAIKLSALAQWSRALATGVSPVGPPEGTQPLLVLRDLREAGAYLGYVGLEDGECYDGQGGPLGFVDVADSTCGDAGAVYLGRVDGTVLRDESDAVVARLDAARGTISDAGLSHAAIVTVSSKGTALRTADHVHICTFEGYVSALFPIIALIFVFLQPSLLSNHSAGIKKSLTLPTEDLTVVRSAATAARAAAEAEGANKGYTSTGTLSSFLSHQQIDHRP